MRFSEIARIPVDDYGSKGTLTPMKEPADARPLPGGSGYKYTVNDKGDVKEILLFVNGELAAELDLYDLEAPVELWGVEGVVAEPEYQGLGLGMALYGIALSILGLTLRAGETQTRHGQRQWLKLSRIPGVVVRGMTTEAKEEYRPRQGDEIMWKTEHAVTYSFPAIEGSRSMRSGRRGTGIYSRAASSMIAQWRASESK